MSMSAEKHRETMKKYVRTQQTFGLFGTAFSGTGDPYQDKKDNGTRNRPLAVGPWRVALCLTGDRTLATQRGAGPRARSLRRTRSRSQGSCCGSMRCGQARVAHAGVAPSARPNTAARMVLCAGRAKRVSV